MRSMLITIIIGSIEHSFLMVIGTKDQKPSFLSVPKNVRFLKQSVLSNSREYETHLVSHILVSQIKVLYMYSLHRFMIRLKTRESISVSVDTR